MKLIDLIGQKFGRLTVIERAKNKGKKTCWKCRCDCGNFCVIAGHELKSGDTGERLFRPVRRSRQ